MKKRPYTMFIEDILDAMNKIQHFLTDKITLGRHSVRQHDTLIISAHLPVVAEFESVLEPGRQ